MLFIKRLSAHLLPHSYFVSDIRLFYFFRAILAVLVTFTQRLCVFFSFIDHFSDVFKFVNSDIFPLITISNHLFSVFLVFTLILNIYTTIFIFKSFKYVHIVQFFILIKPFLRCSPFHSLYKTTKKQPPGDVLHISPRGCKIFLFSLLVPSFQELVPLLLFCP